MPRQPAIFLPHGGGPCFWMDDTPYGQAWLGLKAHLAKLLASLPERPKAFLVVTAHWEEDKPTISVNPAPGMIYDYNNFPPHTYELKYPAPGAPELGRRAAALIRAAGLPVAEEDKRGYDHGVFVPMLIVDPQAEIPVVMVSLQRDLDPAQHIAFGRALAPLRDEGVVIVGSGMTYHDLKNFRNGDPRDAKLFDDWLGEATTSELATRDAALTHWAEAPAGRACHPREEHLIPLMVAVGAAGADVGVRDYSDVVGGKAISGFRFG